MLTTRQKLAIARAASFGLRGARRLVGRGAETKVRRAGVKWHLDLRQGIDLALYLNQYQPIPKRFLEPIAGFDCTVLDIGANIGAFTLPIAQSIGGKGRLVAIEATHFAFQKLQRNISLNPEIASRIIPVHALLGDGQKPSEAVDKGIYSSWRVDGRSESGVHPMHGGSPMSTTGAISATLDDLLDTDPRLVPLPSPLAAVKIDVDGHEISILKGARKTLGANRPSLLIEIAPYIQNEVEGGLAALLSELDVQDYRLHDPITGEPIAHSAEEVERIIPYGASVDLLALPKV